MSAITIGGELIHYEVLGRGRPVILLHGWVGSWRYWVPTMQNLQLKYRVYALDLHGFGDTSKNEQKYTISNQVQLVRDFMETMAIPKAAFVGHGLGAWVAVEFARQTFGSDRVARMMLISPPLFQTPGLESRHRPGRIVPLTSNTPDGFDDRTIANSNSMRAQAMLERELARGGRFETPITPPKLATQEERQPVHNPLIEIFNSNTSEMLLQKCFKRSDPIYTKLEPDLPKTAERALKESAKEFDSGRLLDSIWLLNMPTVILHGKEDVFIRPPSDAVLDYITADKDDNSMMVQLLDGVRHFPMLEYERFLRLLNDFLEIPDISKLEIKERWKRRSR